MPWESDRLGDCSSPACAVSSFEAFAMLTVRGPEELSLDM